MSWERSAILSECYTKIYEDIRRCTYIYKYIYIYINPLDQYYLLTALNSLNFWSWAKDYSHWESVKPDNPWVPSMTRPDPTDTPHSSPKSWVGQWLSAGWQHGHFLEHERHTACPKPSTCSLLWGETSRMSFEQWMQWQVRNGVLACVPALQIKLQATSRSQDREKS